ncbi:MAG: hypothetical protein E7Z64_00980 [Thermoplasmata archaeon]|nr:hypothetical protein [Thermoplasmata archaeon]
MVAEDERETGGKGLTVEKIGRSHYVYWASTQWVPGESRRKKLTEYMGILEPPGNLVISSEIDIEKMNPKAIAAVHIDVNECEAGWDRRVPMNGLHFQSCF